MQRVATIISGWVVLTAGIVMIPYPGPGWLVVFAGLSILAREYPWAQGVLDYARSRYDAWNHWVSRQPSYVRWLTLVGTFLVVIVTLWLLDVYGLFNQWLGLGYDWLGSPLAR